MTSNDLRVTRWTLLLALAVAGTVCGEGLAPHAPRGWSEADLAFLHQAVAAANLDVRMSRIASIRANSDQVRRFAANSADNYSRMRRKLKEIAWTKDLDLSDELDRHQVQRVLLLERHTGDEFDREYLTMQVNEYHRTLRLLAEQAQTGGNDDLRNVALASLSQAEARLKLLQNLADSR
jgi:predicted outer membrane protein